MKSFRKELREWMKDSLSPYCLNECQDTCCKGDVRIDKGYEHLFKVPKIKKGVNLLPSKGHLYQEKYDDQWYFKGNFCSNYNPENKHCSVHGKHPMCNLFPLTHISDSSYVLSKACELHRMSPDEEPLKSLILLCKKYDISLEGKSRGDLPYDFRGRLDSIMGIKSEEAKEFEARFLRK